MIENVKKLRAETGAPLHQIRRALEQSRGDLKAARKLLAQFSKQTARSRSARAAKAGLIESYSHLGKIGVVVRVDCETDFVARNDDFKAFVHELALQIAATNPATVKTLLASPSIKDETQTIADLLAELTMKVGEKVVIAKFHRLELGQG